MDALDLLKRDHREIMKISREVEFSYRKKDGKLDENFNRPLQTLEMHMNIEETVFYLNLISKKKRTNLLWRGSRNTKL
ncbi:MAG TPA: hypothetical protein VHO03_04385 [Ignavibacteriales bacterium]|nr:hypothetical protein [Ignavibacteriales bacterium]